MQRIIIIRWLYTWFGLLGFNITHIGDVLWRDCRYFGRAWLWSWYPCLYIHTHSECCRFTSAARRYPVVTSIIHTSSTPIPANTKHLYNICTMPDQRRRRWADVVQMLFKCFVFSGIHPYAGATLLKGVLISQTSMDVSGSSFAGFSSTSNMSRPL